MMTVSQETFETMSRMCCGPRNHHRSKAFKLKVGILLMIAGMAWYGMAAGLLDFTWMQTVHFWPLILILVGILMVCKGMKHHLRKYATKTNKEA